MQEDRLWNRNFILITISTFLVFFNLQMTLPALSFYIHADIGGNTVIGLSNTVWALFAIATRMVVSRMLAVRDEKPILWTAFVIYTGATALYLVAADIPVLLVVRALYGVGFGLTTTTLGTLVAKAIPRTRMGEGMGYFGVSMSLAMAIAPMVGIGLYNGVGFRWMIVCLTAAMLVIGAVIPFIRVEERSTPVPVSTGPAPKTSRKFDLNDVFHPALVVPSFLLILLSISYAGIVTFLTLFGGTLHIANVGGFFLLDAGAILVVRPVAGRLYDRVGHLAVMPIGALFAIAAMFILAAAHGMGFLYVTAVLYGLGYGVLSPSMQAWMFQRVPADRRSVASSAYFNSMDFGIAVGSLILGAISGSTGYPNMYRSAGAGLIVMLVLYLFFGIREVLGKRVKSTQASMDI